MPDAMRANSHITGIELEPISAKIAAHIHSDVDIINSGFEHYQGQGFDAIIGNPKYGVLYGYSLSCTQVDLGARQHGHGHCRYFFR